MSVHEHASIHPLCPPHPDASLTQPLSATDVHSLPTHSKPPAPQWPPAAGKLPADPQGCTSDGTSALHNTTDNRHHLKIWRTPDSPPDLLPGYRQEIGGMTAQWHGVGDGSRRTPKHHPQPKTEPPWVCWNPAGYSPGLGSAPSPSCPATAGCALSYGLSASFMPKAVRGRQGKAAEAVGSGMAGTAWQGQWALTCLQRLAGHAPPPHHFGKLQVSIELGHVGERWASPEPCWLPLHPWDAFLRRLCSQ